MNKTIYLFALLMVLNVCAKAQERYADLKMVLVTPETGDMIYPDVQFGINSRVYNLGTDTVRLADSLKYMLYFDGFPISFGNSSGGYDSFLVADGRLIAPGDSATFGFGFTIDTSWAGGTTTICTAMMPFNVTGNIYDTILTNNKACATVTIFNTTHIKNVNAAHTTVSIYPNPATTEAFIKLNMTAQAPVSYKIMDMTGRTLLQEDKGIQQAGMHNFSINTSQLAHGTYLYQVTTGGEVQNGRLQVQ